MDSRAHTHGSPSPIRGATSSASPDRMRRRHRRRDRRISTIRDAEGGDAQGAGMATAVEVVVGVGGVLKRALGRYSRLPNAATVVGTSNRGSVRYSTTSPA